MINPEKLREEYKKISQQLSSESILQDRAKYTKLAKRFSYLERIIKLIDVKESYIKEKDHLETMLSDAKEEQEMKDLAQKELDELKVKLENIDEEIEDKVFEGSSPEHDIIIEIRSAAGGEEAALFVASLFKMYSRYAESKGWKIETLSSSPTEIGGFKEIVFSVRGQGAFGRLKF